MHVLLHQVQDREVITFLWHILSAITRNLEDPFYPKRYILAAEVTEALIPDYIIAIIQGLLIPLKKKAAAAYKLMYYGFL